MSPHDSNYEYIAKKINYDGLNKIKMNIWMNMQKHKIIMYIRGFKLYKLNYIDKVLSKRPKLMNTRLINEMHKIIINCYF